MVVACGFSLNDLMNEPQNNFNVKVTTSLIEKAALFATFIDKVNAMG